MSNNNQPETLSEKVRAISDVQVSTAISNLQAEYLAIAKRLRAYSLQIHGSVLNLLQTEFALRQDEMKNAIEEHKFKLDVEQRKQKEEASAKLAAEQEAIAKANAPHLVAVGQARPQ
jgi:hypothetical protein